MFIGTFSKMLSLFRKTRRQPIRTRHSSIPIRLPFLEPLEERLAPTVTPVSLPGWDALSQHPDVSGRREVVVIDPRVLDSQLLLAGIQPGTQVVRLSATGDGLSQIADALAGPAQTTDVHILGHGAPGIMELGDDLLTTATLTTDTAALGRLAAELGPDSDLLLYGCQTGTGSAGAALVSALANDTGAAVAASSRYVGSATLGGGWDLNVASGRIDAASPLSGATLAEYPDRLDGPTITTTTLPNWTVNQPYNQIIGVSGGVAPITFAVTAGSLPTGLVLNSATGAITGTPTTTKNTSSTDVITTRASLRNIASDIDPVTILVEDSNGNLFGATALGTVFEVAAGSGTATTLTSLSNSTYMFIDALVVDSSDNLFVALYTGNGDGGGGVIEVAAGTHTLTELGSFNGTNGYGPADLVEDNNGNLFGTTLYGGAGIELGNPFLGGYGTLFEIVAGSGTITTLDSFSYGDGLGDLIEDSSGNLLGIAESNGTDNSEYSVVEVPAGSGAITTLASFNGTNDYSPSDLVEDNSGNLFGISPYPYAPTPGVAYGDGALFEMPAGSGTVTTLASFNGLNGAGPTGLIGDGSGNLFGTTGSGGEYGDGTVFEVAASSGTITTLASFNGTLGHSGAPTNPLVADSSDNLFGATYSTSQGATMFKVAPGFTVTATDATGASASQSYSMTIDPDFTPTLQYDTAAGGVDVGYDVSGGNVPDATQVSLYWSSSNQFADVIGAPIYTMSIPAGTAAGSYGPFNVSTSALGQPPQGAKYLLAVTDPNNVLGNFDPSQNVQALALPTVTATSISFDDTSLGGVDYSYTVSGGNLLANVPVALYWASGSSWGDQLGQVTGTDDTIPSGTAVGTYPQNVDGSLLVGSPNGTKDLLVVIGNPGSPAFDPTNAVAAMCLALNVPQVYQNQGSWAFSPGIPLGQSPTATIGSSGCALVSLVMALDYAGIQTDPITLNEEATNSYGYSPNTGLLNLAAATEIAVTSALPPQDNIQWNEVRQPVFFNEDEQALRDIITEYQVPVIVQVINPTTQHAHYVVVTGLDGDTFFINDPGYSSRHTLDDYTNYFNYFTIVGYVSDPTTNLSQLYVASTSDNNSVSLSMVDPNGSITGIPFGASAAVNQIPNSFYFEEGPLEYLNGQNSDDTTTAQFVYISQPVDGPYTIEESGPGYYTLAPSGVSSTGQPTQTVVVSGSATLSAPSQIRVNVSGGSVNPLPTITTTTLPNWTVNQPYSQPIFATGFIGSDTFTVTAGSLPTGLSLNSNTGAIAGTPTTSNGPFNFTVQVTDTSGDTASQSYTVTINPAPTITTTTLPNGMANQPYSQIIAVSGGTSPFIFAVTAGSLPAGLSLNSSTGAIIGTPTTSGSPFSFTITITDLVGTTVSESYTVAINAAPPTITTTTLPDSTVNETYSQTIAVSGGTAPITFAVSAGSLPPGLSLNTSTGTITGTPTTLSLSSLAAFNNNSGSEAGTSLVEDSSGTFYGTTNKGGSSNDGTVFEVAAGGSTITTLASFNGADGSSPTVVVENSNGNLFGTTSGGGASGEGTVFEIAAGGSTITTLASFNGTNGSSPAAVVEDSSGNLFGTTSGGGASGEGTVFEVAAGSGTITTLASFNGTNGAYPDAGLVVDSSGNLFDSTQQGGAFGEGTVFEVVAGSGTITTLASFNGTNGAYPEGGLVFDRNGNLFGSTSSGGASGGGTVFEVAAGSGTISTLASFNFTNGAIPEAGLIEDSSGNLFGTTVVGGSSFEGTVFEVAAGSGTITTLASFNGINGANPSADLVEDSSGNLFGTINGLVQSAYAKVFEVAASSGTITTLASYQNSIGAYPVAGLVKDSSGNLFGTTESGGPSGYGTVFEVAAGSGTITTLTSFNGTNGYSPSGLVEDNSGNLFGTTQGGGVSGVGTVFEVAADSGTITTLASFNFTDGAYPEAGLIEDSSGNLFGTTDQGGPSGYGTVFEVTPGSGTITTLASFNYTNGNGPSGLVEDSSGNLFGTTSGAGASGEGTVFEVAAGSGTITTLASFNGTNGSSPIAVVEDSSGNLFGTTSGGGASSEGTVFEVAAGSGTITTLASFNGINGANPSAGLVEDSSGNLFGTTSGGGVFGDGTVFEVVAGSGAITTIYSFNGINGANPSAGLVEDSSGNLFGTTKQGGPNGVGTVFEVTAYTFTIRATDATGASASQSYTVTINYAAPTITTTTLPNGTVNQPYSQTIAVTGGLAPLSFAVTTGSLPTGLSLNSSTGAITGTPTSATSSPFSFTVTTTDAAGATASQNYTFAINLLNNPMLVIATTTLPDWTLNQPYIQTITTSGAAAPVSFAVSGGSLPAGLSLDSTTGVITGAPTSTSGSPFNFAITATDVDDDTASQAYTVTINAVPAITTSTLPNWTVSHPYSQTIVASGGTGPLSFTVSAGNLPTGLSLNNSTGAITGIPTTISGTPFTFTVTATDAASATASQSYSVTINPALSITPTTLPPDTNGTAYSQTVTVSGGTTPYTTFEVTNFSGGTTGLTSSAITTNAGAGTVTISGTPTAPGTVNFTVNVTDSAGATLTQNESFTVDDVPPTASLSGPSSGVLYQPLTFNLGASDPAPADQAGTFTYTVNWGDGTTGDPDIQTVVGPLSTTDTHAYAMAGTCTVTLTATDQYGGVSQPITAAVTVYSTPQIENGVLAIPGTATAATITLTPTLPSGASAYSMKVSYTTSQGTTNYGPYAASTIEVHGGPGTDALTLKGTAGSDSFTIGNRTVSEIAAQTTTFAVDLNAVTTTTLDGNGGSDTLIGSNQTNAWAITGKNAGTLNTAIAFEKIDNLTGGSVGDTFAFLNGGSITGNLIGVASTNTLDESQYGNPVTVNLQTTKATGIGGTWANIQTFIGTGTTDTLVAANTTNTWLISSVNAGTVDGISFAGFPNLTGGNTNDSFAFQPGGSITGNLNGGAPINTLDYSSYGSPVTVNLATKTATGIGGTWAIIQELNGTGTTDTLIGSNANSTWSLTGANSGTVGSVTFAGFANLIGGTGNNTFKLTPTGSVSGSIDGGAGTNTLVGANITNTWDVTGANIGTLDGTLVFADFENLTGGSVDDTFVLLPGGSIAGNLNGAAPTNTLDYAQYGSPVTVNLATKTATGIGGTWTNIQDFIGTSTTDTLLGPSSNSTWSLTGANSGTVGNFTFAGFANLTGGSGNNTFKFGAGASVAGVIDGGGGTSTLDYSSYTTGVYVNLQTLAATGTGGVANIDNVTGSAVGGDILVGNGNANVLTEHAGGNLVIGGTGGGGADTLIGGSGSDILIAGTTSYDRNVAALDALLAAWDNTSLSYSQRVQALQNGVGYTDGTGAHTAELIAGLTVTQPSGSAASTLKGGSSGLDWFFAAVTDIIKNKKTGEFVSTL